MNNRIWECLLCLRDVLFYVCAPALAREHVLLMADVIEEFRDSYRNCFPDEAVKPKFHYTLHYPHLFMVFGPLVHLQSFRFEGNTIILKNLFSELKTKKMCKLLAERHQFYQSTFNTGGDYLSHGNLVSTCGSNVPICLLDNQIQQLLADIIQEESIFLCKSVKFFGIFFALFVQLQIDTKMKNRSQRK